MSNAHSSVIRAEVVNTNRNGIFYIRASCAFGTGEMFTGSYWLNLVVKRSKSGIQSLKQTNWNASGVASPLLLEVWMVEIMLGHLLCSKYIFLWSVMESTRSKSWIVTFNRGAECVPPRGLLRQQPWHCLWLPSGWLGIGCAFSSRLRWSRPWVPVHWSGNFFLDDNIPDVTWLFMYTPQPSSDTSTYRW